MDLTFRQFKDTSSRGSRDMVPGRAQLEAESRDPAVDGVPELLPPTDAMVNIIAGLIAHRSDAEAILAALASMLGAPTALLGDPGIPPSPEPAWLTDACRTANRQLC